MPFTPYEQALARLSFVGSSNIIKRTQSAHNPVWYAMFPTRNLDVCVGWARKAVNIIARLRRPRIVARKVAQYCFSSTFYYLYPRVSVLSILTFNFSDFPSQQRSLSSRNKENRTKMTGLFSTVVGTMLPPPLICHYETSWSIERRIVFYRGLHLLQISLDSICQYLRSEAFETFKCRFIFLCHHKTHYFFLKTKFVWKFQNIHFVIK